VTFSCQTMVFPFELSTDDIKPKNEKYDLHVFLNYNSFDIVVVDPWSVFYFNFFVKSKSYTMKTILDRKTDTVIMGNNKNDYTKMEWLELNKNSFPYQFAVKKIEEYLVVLNEMYVE
jgi:hypothetical protein